MNKDYAEEGKVGMFVIDTDYTDNIFLKSDIDALNGAEPIVAGNSFSKNSSKEVMVSSNFLTKYNLDESIVGKTISLNYQIYSTSDITTSKTSITGNFSAYDNIPVNIFKEYTIVGVYNSDIYKSSPRKNTAGGDSYQTQYDTYFWLTTDSVYTLTGKSYIPEYISIEEDTDYGYSYNRNVYYYSADLMELSKSATSDSRLFIPCGLGAAVTQSSYGNTAAIYNAIVSFETYDHANKAVSSLNEIYKKS